MKPLGTITIYLPFVDSETKQLILKIMEDAENYSDFSKRLAKHVCTTDVSDLSAFFAIHHAMQLYDYPSLDELAQKYADLKLVQPILYFATSYLGGKAQWDKARDVAEEIFESTENLWFKFEMLFTKLSVDVFDFTSDAKTHETVERMESLLKENSELQCFEYRFRDVMAQFARIEGNHEEAIRRTELALNLSQESQDTFREAHLHRIRATLIQRADHHLANELLHLSMDIMKSLGDEVGLGNVLHQLGIVSAIRGEYNSAISYSLQAIKYREIQGMPFGILASNLAIIFNAAGDYENGLSWAELAEEELTQQTPNLLRAKLAKAWSLACKGKLDEVNSIINDTREDIFRSGIDSLLAQHYFTTGLMEFSEKEYSVASSSFEQAYDMNRRLGRAILDTVCLYYLARTEVCSFDVDDSNRNNESSGSWLRLVEEIAESRDLEGVKAQSLLLYARLRMKQGRYDEARVFLSKVEQFAEQSSMTFLEHEFQVLLRKMNQ
ncbi:MAG: hypothetical protein ACW98Y_06020 [Candidatus Thorarchaeota archaeon]|jgi:tetratricopeptide (TPR) repeat protein